MITLELIVGGVFNRAQWVRILSLSRIFRIFTMIKYFRRFLQRFRIDEKTLIVGFLFLYWVMFIHWATCLIVLPAILKSNFEVSKLPGFEGFTEVSLFEKYFRCFYKTVKTIAGLHFNLDKNFDYRTQFYLVAIVIIGRLGLITTFGLIFNIVKGYRSSLLRYEEMMTQLDVYSKYNKIPKVTKAKLKANCNHIFRRKYFNAENILQTVSPTLRQEILLTSASRLVKNSPFFKDLPSSLIFRVISSLQHQIFLQNDIIYTIDSDAHSIYFIITGTVAFYSPSGKEISHFRDGDYFGEICLLSNKDKRICSAMALETTECFT